MDNNLKYKFYIKISSIFNINNIDEESVSFENDIDKIYIRLTMYAKNTLPINLNDTYITRVVSSSNGYVEAGYENEYMVSNVFESIKKIIRKKFSI